jgi:hypothetical protein
LPENKDMLLMTEIMRSLDSGIGDGGARAGGQRSRDEGVTGLAVHRADPILVLPYNSESLGARPLSPTATTNPRVRRMVIEGSVIESHSAPELLEAFDHVYNLLPAGRQVQLKPDKDRNFDKKT